MRGEVVERPWRHVDPLLLEHTRSKSADLASSRVAKRFRPPACQRTRYRWRVLSNWTLTDTSWVGPTWSSSECSRCHEGVSPEDASHRCGAGNEKTPLERGFLACAEEDSNLHPVIPDQALNLARLPIPPSAPERCGSIAPARAGGRVQA